MNTEVSVNPSIEIDLRVFSGINGTSSIHYVHPQTTNASSYNGRLTRLRSSVMRQPQPIGPPPPAIVHVNGARKDIPVSGLPAIQVSSIKSMANTNDLDIPRGREGSPSLSPSPSRELPPAVFSNFQPTQINYPRMSAPFHPDMRYDQPPPPLRSPRVRSPHDMPRSPPHLNGDGPPHHGHMPQAPVGLKEDTPDGNPTVYVLPNDFDLNGGYEPHFSSYGPISHDDMRRHDEMRRHEEMRRQEEIRRQEEMRRQREARIQEERKLEESEMNLAKRMKQEPISSFALPTQVRAWLAGHCSTVMFQLICLWRKFDDRPS